MFLPFLPFILAMAGLTALVTVPDAAPAHMTGWQTLLGFAALPLIGFLLGNLPESALGSRSPMRFSARRIALLALWLTVVSGLNLHPELKAALGGQALHGEAALALLLINYWFSDGLALRGAGLVRRGGAPRQWPLLVETLGIPLPVLVLFLLSMGGTLLFDRLFSAETGGAGLPPAWQAMVTLATFVAVMSLAVPLTIRVCWRFRPLDSPEAERVIREELAANGIRGTRVFQWPEGVMGATTAAMIGLVSPFRYMLIGPSIANALTPDELRSVTAHEAAHVKHRHLWYYLAAIFAFILFMQLALEMLLVGTFLLDAPIPLWMGGIIEVAALLIFLRYGIGLLSRYFERQADGNAYRRHGLAAFQSALAKVGVLNRIPAGQDNWHHYGISRRIDYLLTVETEAGRLEEHDRRVLRIKMAVLSLLAVCVVAQPLLGGARWLPLFADSYLADRLDSIQEPTAAELEGVQYLASEAFRKSDFASAERYFRLILIWRPEDPQAQNNLAWLLVTRPEAGRAAVREGLRLAERASELRQAAYIWDTLAEAYDRADQPDKAEAAADMALRLAEEGRERGDAPLNYYRERWKTFSRPGGRG